MEEAAKKKQESVTKIPQGGQMTAEQQKQIEDAGRDDEADVPEKGMNL
jgi:hypothetical protein